MHILVATDQNFQQRREERSYTSPLHRTPTEISVCANYFSFIKYISQSFCQKEKLYKFTLDCKKMYTFLVSLYIATECFFFSFALVINKKHIPDLITLCSSSKNCDDFPRDIRYGEIHYRMLNRRRTAVRSGIPVIIYSRRGNRHFVGWKYTTRICMLSREWIATERGSVFVATVMRSI